MSKSREHDNAARKAAANASRAGLGKRTDALPAGGGLRAALGDGLIGLGLIAVLMAVFLGVFLIFRRERGPTPVAVAPLQQPQGSKPANVRPEPVDRPVVALVDKPTG